MNTILKYYHFLHTDGGTPASPSGTLPPFKINFMNLYEAFCKHLKDDQTTLLLYLLLHRNLNFRTFILSRTNIDQLVSGCTFFK